MLSLITLFTLLTFHTTCSLSCQSLPYTQIILFQLTWGDKCCGMLIGPIVQCHPWYLASIHHPTVQNHIYSAPTDFQGHLLFRENFQMEMH